MNDYFFFDCFAIYICKFQRSELSFHYLGFSGFFYLQKSGLIFKRAVATLVIITNVVC